MVYSLPRWTLNQDRENRLNDLYRYQSEEQRAALERQGQARTKGIEATYKGIADSIDKGMEGYERGKQAKRAEGAYEKEQKLADASLAASEEQLAANRMERGEKEKQYAARPADYHSRMAGLDISQAEESLASSKAGRQLTQAQMAALGKEERRYDQTRAETELNATMDTIQSLTAQRNLLENQLRGPLSEEGRAQAQAQLANTTAQINQLTLTAQALSQKAGLSEPALLVRGTQAASRYKSAQEQALATKRITETAAPGYNTAHAQLVKANEEAAKVLQAVDDLGDYDRATLGTDAADKAYNKFLSAMSPEEAEFVKKANYITGTPTARMQKVLEQKRNSIQTSINAARATVTAENATTLQPSIAAAEAQLKQIDAALSKLGGGGFSTPRNAPLAPRPQGPGILTGGGQPPGAPPSLR